MKKAIRSKWVSRIKQKTKFNQVDKYKAQLVKGFAQTNGIDFSKTYTSIAKFSSIITLLALEWFATRKAIRSMWKEISRMANSLRTSTWNN